MKTIYKTPEIKVEELVRKDVLCSSTDYNIEQSMKGWSLVDSVLEDFGLS
ncbi:MAG: hypothetical protein IJ725_01390 [Ruminococcus sp.]|nr:hypothetical protein [Ruminococcus sp.]